MDKRAAGLLLGFLLFVISLLSIILSLVGVSLTFLKPLDDLGFLISTTIKGLMLFGGIILVYILQTNNKNY